MCVGRRPGRGTQGGGAGGSQHTRTAHRRSIEARAPTAHPTPRHRRCAGSCCATRASSSSATSTRTRWTMTSCCGSRRRRAPRPRRRSRRPPSGSRTSTAWSAPSSRTRSNAWSRSSRSSTGDRASAAARARRSLHPSCTSPSVRSPHTRRPPVAGHLPPGTFHQRLTQGCVWRVPPHSLGRVAAGCARGSIRGLRRVARTGFASGRLSWGHCAGNAHARTWRGGSRDEPNAATPHSRRPSPRRRRRGG